MKKIFSLRAAAYLAGLVAGWTLAGSTAVTAQVAASLQNVATSGNVYLAHPEGFLVSGPDGNFYGTTSSGGTSNRGTIFRATPAGVVTTIYSFTGGNDGSSPGRLLLGSDGSLYGSSSLVDGTSTTPFANYHGSTIFRCTLTGVLTTLQRFDNQSAGLTLQGRDGNFYGTTNNQSFTVGVAAGTVFRLTPTGELTTLHTFAGGNDGDAALCAQGRDGNLYGTTGEQRFLVSSASTVFRLTTAGEYTVLHQFTSNEGTGPGGLVEAADGSFYGTTFSTVFRLTPEGVLTTLHAFAGHDGIATGSLTLGRDGNLYGTTQSGGTLSLASYGADGSAILNGSGTLFQLTSQGDFTTLYNFGDAAGTPTGRLVQADDGLFYGTTRRSGFYFVGDVSPDRLFALRVATPPVFFKGQVPLNDGTYYLSFTGRGTFGYYAFLGDDLSYIYHYDLGYEKVFDAADGAGGVYLYDFASNTFFYTSRTFGFPYLYDFSLNAVLYYYPDPNNPGRYNTNGTRYFYNFTTGQIITK